MRKKLLKEYENTESKLPLQQLKRDPSGGGDPTSLGVTMKQNLLGHPTGIKYPSPQFSFLLSFLILAWLISVFNSEFRGGMS